MLGCGPVGSIQPPSGPPLPAGYRLFDGGSLGFGLGLAPGWRESGRDQSGVNFADPAQGAAMLVHVEQATSANLDAAAGAVMFELTGGSGAAGGAQGQGKLSGLAARRVSGAFEAAGAMQRIDALVTLEGGRAWALVLAGPAARVAADETDFEQMTGTFRLGSRPPALPVRAIVGQPAPGFPELDRVKGPVVVNFFATWCGPCRQEMPMLAQRAEQAHGRFTVLAVNTQDDPAKVPGFLKELGLSFGSLAYDRDGHLGQEYQLPGVPGTFFLDAHHVLRQWVLGPLDQSSLDQGIKAATG